MVSTSWQSVSSYRDHLLLGSNLNSLAAFCSNSFIIHQFSWIGPLSSLIWVNLSKFSRSVYVSSSVPPQDTQKLGSVADRLFFFLFFFSPLLFYLYFLFKNCHLWNLIFLLEQSQLHIFAMWSHFLQSGLIEIKKSTSCFKTHCRQKQEEILITSFFCSDSNTFLYLFQFRRISERLSPSGASGGHFPTSKLSSVFHVYSTQSPVSIRCLN